MEQSYKDDGEEGEGKEGEDNVGLAYKERVE